MKKPFAVWGIAFALIGLAGSAWAQSPVAQETRQAKLLALSVWLGQRDADERRSAHAYARGIGIPVRRELPDGRVLELQRWAPGTGPVFYITFNIDAADTVSTDEVWSGGSAGLSLSGSGMTMAQWDGGSVFAEHPDFTGRLSQVDGATEVSGHSTHVAGTLIGDGDDYPESRGMAWQADLDAYDWNSDTAEMATAAATGQLVSNHSYGVAAGWLYIGGAPPDTWWWIGGADPSIQEDTNFGYYDTESQLWDQIAFDAPYYLIVKAAGNDRSDIGAAPGEEYTIIDQDGSFVTTSTDPRPADCAPAGYDCLPTHSVAKNILTVGAVDDLIGGYSPIGGPSQVQMSDFSSWGPTDDGRIKPDLVGNGVFLFSAWPDAPYFALAAGTSMATPNVSGSLLLLQEHYQNQQGPGSYLRAATLKALAIHTADEAGSAPGPDYAYGWGVLNTKSAAGVITDNGGGDHLIIEGHLANGASDTHAITVSQAGSVLVATLAWADPPGTPPAPALDPADLMLVNDLDLRVIRGEDTWFPWILDPADPSAAATQGDNFRDNVEQVEVTETSTGTYTVEVRHEGTLQDAPQAYSLIISVNSPPPTGSAFLIDEDFSGGMPPGWSVDTPMGVPWTIQSPGSGRYQNDTGGSGNFAMVDNNYSNTTVTSLRTPVLDLSANDAAVLRFSSGYYYDTFESINVDASTNGGTTWFTVWSFQGFNPFPTRYVMDLSSAIAGEPSARLRFRFDSHGWISGDYWKVDDVELEVFGGSPPPGDPPGTASDPSPADGSVGLTLETDLSWSSGTLAESHDVYFGTANPPGAGQFRGNQTVTTYDPGPLDHGTAYYWRIDEVNADGTTTGSVWHFMTEPASSKIIHLSGFEGTSTPEARGRWSAEVRVHVADQDDAPEADVTVEGNWSEGANGADSCTTASDGSCILAKGNLKPNVSSVTFTVTGLVKPDTVYDPAANTVPESTVVAQSDTDAIPVAVDDAVQTEVNVAVSGNVLANDDPGDGPATVESHTQPASGVLTIAPDGTFTYTPDSGFEGTDGFEYRIIDQDGDLSNVATVAIDVLGVAPPPAGDPAVSATPFKIKGVQHVTIGWNNFPGALVDISRDGAPIADSPTANDGSHEDNVNEKGGGVTYTYTVCEAGTATCASATASF